MAEQKTNVMRQLDRAKIAYSTHEYPHGDSAVDGVTVAGLIGKDSACVFKTLVARGSDQAIYVFVIPVAKELDLKAAARAVGAKSVAMVHVSEINTLTGYIRGGCSPVGMKKQYKTVIDDSALDQETMVVSAGRIGHQIDLAPADLIRLTRGKTADIIKS